MHASVLFVIKGLMSIMTNIIMQLDLYMWSEFSSDPRLPIAFVHLMYIQCIIYIFIKCVQICAMCKLYFTLMPYYILHCYWLYIYWLYIMSMLNMHSFLSADLVPTNLVMLPS